MTKVWNKYGPTAARPSGKPGRENKPSGKIIDMHSHIAVPAAADFVKPHLTDLSWNPLAQFAAPDTKELGMQQDKDRTSRMTAYDERLRDMDGMGIDMQVVMPPPPQCYYTVPIDVAVKAAHIINDGVAEYVGGKPDRFAALGTVPMPDGEEAAKELERCVKTLGFKGAQILTNVAGKEISEPQYEPFWAKAEELGAVILIHPNGFTDGRRFAKHYFNNVIGNPLETTLALHNLIFDGVLERHPNLKIIAVHGGGYLGGYSGRIDHVWGARSDGKADLPHPPTSYLKKVYVDTVVFTPHQLQALVDLFGVDHVLMGTDYPYDMADYDPLEHLMSAETLDERARGRIAGGNAQRLFGL